MNLKRMGVWWYDVCVYVCGSHARIVPMMWWELLTPGVRLGMRASRILRV